MKKTGTTIPRPRFARYRTACVIGVPALLAAGIAVAQEENPTAADPVKFILSDRYMFDDNLFRLPDGQEPFTDPTTGGPPRSRDDQINRASAGLRVRLDQARQVFHADVQIDDVRYRENDDLDFTGGSGDILWDWQVASNWSGRVFGKYNRAQANLENYRFFQQDIVETATYGGELRYGVGSRWRIFAGAAAADTDHSAELREVENFESTTGRGGIEYITPAGSSLALEYLATAADFPVAEELAGAPRGYDEDIPTLRGRYVYSVKTMFMGSVGYLDRDYDNPLSEDYAGVIWTAGLYWEPRAKLKFELEAWRKLRAYSDAESDYFVGEGVSITPRWEPTHTISLSAVLSYEKQDYEGNNLLLPPIDAGREDEVTTAQIGLDYTPREYLSLGLAYRWNDRDSNREELRSYSQNQTSAQIKFMF